MDGPHRHPEDQGRLSVHDPERGQQQRTIDKSTGVHGRSVAWTPDIQASAILRVPGAGLEPACPYGQTLLRRPRMPIPPSRPAHHSALNHPDASSARTRDVRSVTVACADCGHLRQPPPVGLRGRVVGGITVRVGRAVPRSDPGMARRYGLRVTSSSRQPTARALPAQAALRSDDRIARRRPTATRRKCLF